MNSAKEIIEYVCKNGNHYLGTEKSGLFAKPPYPNTTYYRFGGAKLAFGLGAEGCIRKLFMTEKVVCAFTCRFRQWPEKTYEPAIVCLTSKGRALVGFEVDGETEEIDLYKKDIEEMRWNVVEDSKNYISIGKGVLEKCFLVEHGTYYGKVVIGYFRNVIEKYVR